MVPEIEADRFASMTDRELAEYTARMLARLEPLLTALENPPPMLAAMMPGFGIDGG
jgi:hypothetical protein